MALFVYVATTEGLVQVQGIAEEDPDIDSLVCLDGSMQQLPISRDYHQFVKKGSGLIHKDFNHGAFRLDVDKSIDSGKSWQLGFYMAHYALSNGQLGIFGCGKPQADDIVIWATGEVKIDKSLAAVAGVRQKCQQSEDQLKAWQSAGVKLLCVLPSANQNDLVAIDGVEFLPCDNLADVLEAFDGLFVVDEADSKSPTGNGSEATPWYWRYKKSLVMLSAIALFFIVVDVGDYLPVGGLAAQVNNSGEDVYMKPVPVDVGQNKPTKLYLQASIKTSSNCDNPKNLRFMATDFRFTAVRLDSLCQLQLVLPKGNLQVMGVALDTGGEIPVQQIEAKRWDIAIPSSKYQNRDYLLLLFDESFYDQGRNPLVAQMRRWRWDDKSLSARLIQDWVSANHWPVTVYRHQLQDD